MDQGLLWAISGPQALLLTPLFCTERSRRAATQYRIVVPKVMDCNSSLGAKPWAFPLNGIGPVVGILVIFSCIFMFQKCAPNLKQLF